MTKIIAFSGRKGHGKDTAVSVLKELKGNTAIGELIIAEFSFASILKEIACDSLKMDQETGELIKRREDLKFINGNTYREYLNTLGDAIKSRFGFGIWAEMITKDINTAIQAVKPEYVLINDLRYPVEEAHLRKYAEDNTDVELTVVKMIRTGVNQEENEHESESLIDEIKPDLTIEAQNLEELRQAISLAIYKKEL